jgi:hypothetical protein
MLTFSDPIFGDIKKRLISLNTTEENKFVLNYSHSELQFVPSLLRFIPKNIICIKLDYNKIKMINNIPISAVSISCSHNQIQIIDLTMADKIDRIYAPYNNIRRIIMSKLSKLSEIDLSNNNLKYIPDITNEIIINKFDLSYNNLTHVYLGHMSITQLYLLSNVNLDPLKMQLPFQLKYLNIGNCNLTHLPRLPKTLEILVCSGNLIAELNNLPHNLKTLHASGNKIKYLNKLPVGLNLLTISSNLIMCLTCKVSDITYFDNPHLKYVIIPKLSVFELPDLESNCCYYPITILKTKCPSTSKILLNSSALCIQRIWRGCMARQKLFYERHIIEI